MENIKEYSNDEVTIVWKPEKCIHSGICVRGLPKVFKPKDRPWITINAATTEDLVNTVKKCPSGALSYYMNASDDQETQSLETKVEILENGPLLVFGTLKIIHKDGSEETKNRTTAFCRCGASQNKPYCDGAHIKENFEG
ncbi:(4Fe-4S)-binding protein [Ichthyenterobacterium sp. W332]|uniref:(4Fe-4S)-binding protein n=1 Tax=Microcosmobacter mediterraneus TaxID=3075607 RepID=A0ABU2YM31_9FLAO|nr:(4Fe-4S)-binding protein [Ichthyenterobacterium sp. W332]MDT0558325.1 (4Fe-4S)-binding protein [Ichthyenterobacterium sp. W332]